tara:strand:+ start:853 stop:1119 length:267 start_codon:yes stop_codon:yes gene_type:complete
MAGEDSTLAHLLAFINTEVFTKKPENPNKPIKKTSSRFEQIVMIDDVLTNDYADANPTFIWGPGGISDTAVGAAVDTSVRWGFTGQWG